MFRGQQMLSAWCAALLLTGCATWKQESRSGPASFHAFTSLSQFTRADTAGAVTLLSPEISDGPWDELIASWNAVCPDRAQLVVEVRALPIETGRWTRFYTLGIWSESGTRQSVRRQQDKNAMVDTDTLVCRKPMHSAQIRLTLTGEGDALPMVKFLGISFFDTRAPRAAPSRTNYQAWGRTLDVPQRSQLGHKGANGWCSPTAVSMMLAYWAGQLQRPELDLPVPAVAAGVYDPNWRGTGNWVFNTAFAGKFAGLRAYVTRFNEMAQVEDLIAAGIPVALSVSFDLLNGKQQDMGNGHLIVAVGFNEHGDVVVNDPWPNPKHENSVRKIFPRERVLKAWQRSRNAAYIICPEEKLPAPACN